MLDLIRLYGVLALFLVSTSVAKTEHFNDKNPAPALMAAIAGWVSANYGLPNSDVPPRVEFVPQRQLERLRYRRIQHGAERTLGGEGRAQAVGGEHATPRPQFQRDIVAVYDDATETIYLSENWKGISHAELSVLVHEMVHHLQNRAQLTYACAGAREKPAYLAQKKWLESHGLDFEQELQVDMFTVVAMSACME
jgi:hypothetical protein